MSFPPPPPQITPPWQKIYIFGILVKRAICPMNFIFI